jgi:hypothetical protein
MATIEVKATRFAFPLAVLLLGAAPAASGKTLYFALSEDGARWCGSTSKALYEQSNGPEAAKVTFAGGRVSRLTNQISTPSGDWIVTDEYVVAVGMVRLERQVGLANVEVQGVKRGAARIGQPIRLKLISARWPDGSSAVASGWYDPPVPVTSNVETFPFVRLGRTMLRQNLRRLCQPAKN